MKVDDSLLRFALQRLEDDSIKAVESLTEYVRYLLKADDTEFDDYLHKLKAYDDNQNQIVMNDICALFKFGLIDEKTSYTLTDKYLREREKVYGLLLREKR